MHEEFLRNVIDYDSAPLGTRFRQLLKAGVALPAPESLDDAALHAKIWEIVRRLAEWDVYLAHTDHLSDRELYEHLWRDSLREQGPIFPPGSGWINHIDLIGGCSEEDIEVGLRYYDDEEQRQRWSSEFPDYVIPPHESPPYDRDRLLPKEPPPPPPPKGEWDEDEEDEEDGFADGHADEEE
ncbi:MAG: hypothetical protein WD749_09540 [Phycisphaerales bacterium]